MDNKEIKVDEINSVIATHGALLLVLAVVIALNIMFPFSLVGVLALVNLVIMVFDAFFSERFFGPRIKLLTDIFCVAFLVMTMPAYWFYLGGLHGVGPMWFLFGAVYGLFGLSGRAQNFILSFFGVEVLVTIAITLKSPELVNSIDPKYQTILCIGTLLAVGLYVQVVAAVRNVQFTKDKERIVAMQDELTAQVEEGIAMNDELIHVAEKLELNNKTQRSFSAAMNHELRAPLNGIEGCLQILMQDETMSDNSKEMIKNALTASMTINQTINDILDFTKLDEGQFEIVENPFDLRDILDDISTIFRPLAAAKKLQFIIQIPKDARISLVGDGVRIQQIMTNLISNGIKYTDMGSVTMRILTQRGHLRFVVEDTGQGMSEEDIKVLFDPFTRFNTKHNANIQGTGLGMNIVYNMVQAMKGSVTVESKLNEGTVFSVDIPIMFYDSDITMSSPRLNRVSAPVIRDLSNVKVLCVDDMLINRTVFKGMLKKSGAEVTVTDNGKKALELCRDENFDIVFLDHMMPGMDGIEVLVELKKLNNGKYKDIPVIMFTGNAGDEYKKLYKDNGATDYLLKPVMLDKLLECFDYIGVSGK